MNIIIAGGGKVGQNLLRKLSAETAAFRAEEGRSPTAAELAARTDWATGKVEELLALNGEYAKLYNSQFAGVAT